MYKDYIYAMKNPSLDNISALYGLWSFPVYSSRIIFNKRDIKLYVQRWPDEGSKTFNIHNQAASIHCYPVDFVASHLNFGYDPKCSYLEVRFIKITWIFHFFLKDRLNMLINWWCREAAFQSFLTQDASLLDKTNCYHIQEISLASGWKKHMTQNY